jgi:hypothetical protein
VLSKWKTIQPGGSATGDASKKRKRKAAPARSSCKQGRASEVVIISDDEA